MYKLWHPFAQMKTARPFLSIVRGEGTCLYAQDGRPFLDGTSSWWVNLHGHAHPYIRERLQAQAELLEHVTFADFTHPCAIELAERLLPLLPGQMTKAFYSDNGSTAVEVALKMAFQYWHNRDPATKRRTVVCLQHSYHGETFGAMAASGKNEFNRPFWNHLFEVEMLPSTASLDRFKHLLNQETVACFIFEPLISGVGGMKLHPAEELNKLIQLCRKHDVLAIADEVMTGFGRTGSLFACDQLQEKPDIICLSKGITGGYLPLGLTACREFIYEAFLSDHRHHALLHGHSYTANPLACSCALASLDLLLLDKCTMQRKTIASSHTAFCTTWRSHPKLKRCQSLGTILILEYHNEVDSYFTLLRDKLYDFCLDRGVLLRPLGNVLYMMPPYCIQPDELEKIYTVISQTLEGDL